jgi:hypothetical protein
MYFLRDPFRFGSVAVGADLDDVEALAEGVFLRVEQGQDAGALVARGGSPRPPERRRQKWYR